MHEDMVLFGQWAKMFLDPALSKQTIMANLKDNKAKLSLDLVKVKRSLSKEEYF